MLKEETLSPVESRTYEEPEGEFLEVIESGNNTITVLTRVDTDKVGGVEPEEVLPDPSKYSVSDLKDELAEKVRTEGLTDEQRETLLEQEKQGKDRTTAKTAIKNQ